MSRFWEAASESESEESDSIQDSEDSGDEEEGNNFFLGSSSSDDDDEGRVILSTKQKRFREMKNTIDDIKVKTEANDWNGIQAGFDTLCKQYEKSSNVIRTEGIPTFFIRALVRIEDVLEVAISDKEAKKKMSSTNAKSLNSMKQKLRKYNKNFTSEIEKFRENPINTDDEEEEGSDSGSDSDSDDEPATKKKGSKKKVVVEEEPAVVPEKIVWTRALMKAKLGEMMSTKGKKGTDPMAQVKELQSLVGLTNDVQTNLDVLLMLIAAQFDARASSASLPMDEWRKAYSNIMQALNTIEGSKLRVVESNQVDFSEDQQDEEEGTLRVQGSLLAFCERLDDEFMKALQGMDPHVNEYSQRLKDENLYLVLAVRIEHYYTKLGDQFAVDKIALRRIEHLYYKREALNPFRVIGQAYIKHTKGDKTVVDASPKRELPAEELTALGPQGAEEVSMTITQAIGRLAGKIYKGKDDRAKTRVMLCQVYNYALEDKYYQARDLFLMSHLQDGVNQCDVAVQILFNRTMVQLGLCAFRLGLINDAHSCLSELHSSGRIKELLAQGISRYTDKNPEQERQARARLIPYHMHVNLELVDSIHLICAMLLEVPNMVLNSIDTKRKVLSRPFRRLLEYQERQVFTGPPENTHDFIMAASTALGKGDVDKCTELLLNLKVWKLVSNPEPVKEMLTLKIREEGLRTYLFRYSHLYKSINVKQLAETFHLSPESVHSIVSKMIVNEELFACWDQPTQCLVMHRVEPTRLQSLAIQFSDKAAALVENNEKLLDGRAGSQGFEHVHKSQTRDNQRDWNNKRGYHNHNRGRRGGYHNQNRRDGNHSERRQYND